MQLPEALVLLFGLIALLVFLSLTTTALLRPDHLTTLIEAYKVIALALIGRKYSNHKPPSDDAAGSSK